MRTVGLPLPAPPSLALHNRDVTSTSSATSRNFGFPAVPSVDDDSSLPAPQDLLVREVAGGVQPRSRFAFCFSDTGWELLVSNSGHETILRGRDKRDFAFGGWADLKTGRIWAANGTIKNVPKRWRATVAGALENHFRQFFRWH